MNTCIISDPYKLEEAVAILKKGGLVASPTETVYGLCANALNEQAVKNIYVAKGRPSDNPLIVHISSLDMLPHLVQEISPIAETLMQHFWPGPMTLIFKASPIIPKVVTGGLDTVAVRFPSHPVICQLITESQLPLAAPSANTSGKPSPTNFERVYEDLNGKVDCIIHGDDCELGVESTVIDTTEDKATICRPGGITFEMLSNVLGDKVMIDPALGHALTKGEQPKAPGMKYTHYSPNADVIIVKSLQDHVHLATSLNALIEEQQRLGKRVGVMATDETYKLFKANKVISVGSEKNLLTVAAHLFEGLRCFDDENIDLVYALAFKKHDIGMAIMNRLEKSAGYHTIEI